jgi:hypothetical protein
VFPRWPYRAWQIVRKFAQDYKQTNARLAQLVERRSHNPEVGSSILPLRMLCFVNCENGHQMTEPHEID